MTTEQAIAAIQSASTDDLTLSKGSRRKVTNADVAQHIDSTMGNVAAIARALHVSRGTVWNRIQASPDLQAQLGDARESMLDNAESSLYRKVIAGDIAAICFFLKTQGKSRGYVERSEVTGKDGGPVAMTWGEFVKSANADAVRSTT